jgi:putative MFS transporter
MSEAVAGGGALDGYQRRLFFFLSVATFFEGYDFLALAQLLPSIRAEFRLSPTAAGALVAAINVGTILAYVLVRQADRWGRRRVMAVTIAGYTLCSALTAAAVGPVSFGVAQLLARIFLIAEWAVAMVYAAEEFPASRRGMVIGVIQGCSGLGAVVCAAVVPLLLKASLGWRTVYLVGALPLALVAFARRSLRETARFKARQGAPTGGLLAIWSSPHRTKLIRIALCWFFAYLCSNTAVTFWKEFAVSERSWTNAEVGKAVATAALVSMPLSFAVGKLIDRIGRRLGAVVVCSVMSAGCVAAYTLQARSSLTVALIGAMFAASAILAVFNALTAELFPTELRADAFAWSNNLLGRTGYVLAPLAVGAAAERIGWGPSVAATAVGPLIAMAIVWASFPETRGRELEETSAL